MRADERFRASVEAARVVEEAVAAWLASRGWRSLPVYDFSGLSEDKAPKLRGASDIPPLVLPDLLAARAGASKFVEVKHKASTTPGRISGLPETGIDRRLWEHYRQVEAVTGIPVWLVFVHDAEREVRGQAVSKLALVARYSPKFNCNRGGMFFLWEHLLLVATLDEVMTFAFRKAAHDRMRRGAAR